MSSIGNVGSRPTTIDHIAGAAPARDERNLVLVAPGEDARDLVGAPRADDGIGPAVKAPPLGLVAEIRGRSVENDALARKDRAEIALERSRSHVPSS